MAASKGKPSKRQTEAVKRDRSRRQVWSVVLFAIGILLILFSFVGDASAEVKNGADHIHSALRGLFGLSVYLTGPVMLYIAIIISANKGKATVAIRLIQLIAFILLISAFMQIVFSGEIDSELGFLETLGLAYEQGTGLAGGGVVGLVLGYPLLLFGRVAATIIILLIVFVVIMLTANITLAEFLKAIAIPFKKLALSMKQRREIYREDSGYLREEREKNAESERIRRASAKEMEEEITKASPKSKSKPAKPTPEEDEIERRLKFASIEMATNSVRTAIPAASPENTEGEPLPPPWDDDAKPFHEEITRLASETAEKPPEEPSGSRNPVIEAIEEFQKEEDEAKLEGIENEKTVLEAGEPLVGYDPFAPDDEPADPTPQVENEYEIEDISLLAEQYTLPPVVLLNDIIQEKSDEEISIELEENSIKLVDTLKSFGVQTRMVGVCRGPSVTRYELQPASGVKIANITKLVDDIALNMATAGVRIEAPIPNKAAVGIEVPNRKVDTVPFRSLVDSETFRKTDSRLGAAIGMDISGETIIADIAKMPHMLIAGTTGSGKSVCVNSIIMSILFRSTPDEVRLLMIDPKAVEFMIYNGIPHLLIPVVTDPKKASGALGWAVSEMLDRYKRFSDNNVRDLAGYNALAKNNPELKPLPQIVIFIDELADLMMASPKEVEDSICRLAQMARAAGMHLVIATQRPSVNVVTGVIKANIPSRIALKVASQVDSRTIIDSAGAEKLLGKGDMLYFPVGAPKPMRVQGCWVSEKEVDRVVDFIKNSFILDYDESVIEEIDRQAELAAQNDKNGKGDSDIDLSDDKLDEAIEAVLEAGQASTSALQRRLKLGYGRAARLIDTMEEMGIVGPFEGSKPRQVLMSKQDWYEMKLRQQ